MTLGYRYLVIIGALLALAGCGGGVQSGSTESKFDGVQTAVALSPTSVKINWKKNEKVKEYSIFEAASSTPISTTIFDNSTVKNLNADTSYTFKVVGTAESNSVGMQKEVRVKTWPRFTGISDLTVTSPETMMVKWEYSENPISYLVYVSVDTPPTAANTEDWKKYTAMTQSKSYTITSVLPSKTYYVTVHAQYTSDEFERPAKTLSQRSDTTFRTPEYSLSKISIGTLPFISVNPIPDANHLRSEFRSQAFWKGNPVSDPLQGAGNIVFSSSAGLPIGKVDNISLKVEYGSGATLETKIIEGLETYIKGIAAHAEKPQSLTLPQGASNFGKALARGDFNCDGADDLAVGVPDIALAEYGAKDPGIGAVFIYYSKKVGDRYVLQTSPAPKQNPATPGTDPQIITMDDMMSSTYLGYSLSAGNLNGDRIGDSTPCDDLIAGAPGFRVTSGAFTGAAFVFFGGVNGLRAAAHVKDMAVNTETCDGKVEGATCSAVILRPDYSLLPESFTGGGPYKPYINDQKLAISGSNGPRFGHSVSFIGDFDANGYQDVAIGAPEASWAGPVPNFYANDGYLGRVGYVSVYVGSRFGVGRATIDGQQVRQIDIFPPIPEADMRFGTSVSGGADVDGRHKIRLADGTLAGGSELIIGAPNFTYAHYESKNVMRTSMGTTPDASIITPKGGGWVVPGRNLGDTTNYYGWPQDSGIRVGAAFLYYGYSHTSASGPIDYDNASRRSLWWACGRRGMELEKHFSCLASQESYSILFPRKSSSRGFGSAVALVGDASRFRPNSNDTIEPRTSANVNVPYEYYSDANGDGYADVFVSAPGTKVGEYAETGVFWQFFGNYDRQFSATEMYNVTASGSPTASADFFTNSPACDEFSGSGKKANCRPTLIEPTSLASGSRLGNTQNQIAAGDVSGDGLKDLVIGSSGDTTVGSASGAVLVFPSAKGSGIVSSYKKLYGLQTTKDDRLGSAVTVGNFNNDFVTYKPDALVIETIRPLNDVFGGAPNDTSQTPSVGSVMGWITDGYPLPSTLSSTSNGQGGQFVLSEKVASFSDYGAGDSAIVGDINGDGFDDAVAKETQYLADGSVKVDAIVFYGSPYGVITKDFCLANKAVVFKSATTADSYCYASTSVVSGLTNDGITLPQKILRPSNLPGRWFDKAVYAGDVNKDGFGDVLFAATGTDSVVVLYFGARGGLQNVVDPTYTPNVGDPQIVSRNINVTMQNAFSGQSLEQNSFRQRHRIAAGDFNGDGYMDVALGVPQKASTAMNFGTDPTDAAPVRGGENITAGTGWNCGGAANDPDCTKGTAVDRHGMIWVLYGGQRGYQTPAVRGYTTGDMNVGTVGTMTMLDTEVSGATKPCIPGSGGSAAICEATYLRNVVWENIAFGYSRLNHYFGAAVETMKVDKDQYDDVLVGSPGYEDISCYSGGSNQAASYGRVFIFYGSAEGLLAGARDEYYRWERSGLGCPVVQTGDSGAGDPSFGLQLNTRMRAIAPPPYTDGNDEYSENRTRRAFGLTIANVGDVNGDGLEDVLFGSPNESVKSGTVDNATGAMYLYYGPLCAMDNDAGLGEFFQSDSLGSYDYKIGVQTYYSGAQPPGTPSDRIYTFNFDSHISGDCLRSNTLGIKPLPLKFTVLGAVSPDKYGYGMTSTRAKKGDFNGDGFDDVLVGSFETADTATNNDSVGQGVVFFGSSVGLNVADYPTISLSEGSNGSYRPFLIKPKVTDAQSRFFLGNITSGDVNGDKTADYMVTSRYYNGTGTTKGIWIGTFFIFY